MSTKDKAFVSQALEAINGSIPIINSANLNLPVVIGNQLNPDNIQPLMVYGSAVFSGSVYADNFVSNSGAATIYTKTMTLTAAQVKSIRMSSTAYAPILFIDGSDYPGWDPNKSIIQFISAYYYLSVGDAPFNSATSNIAPVFDSTLPSGSNRSWCGSFSATLLANPTNIWAIGTPATTEKIDSITLGKDIYIGTTGIIPFAGGGTTVLSTVTVGAWFSITNMP